MLVICSTKCIQGVLEFLNLEHSKNKKLLEYIDLRLQEMTSDSILTLK